GGWHLRRRDRHRRRQAGRDQCDQCRRIERRRQDRRRGLRTRRGRADRAKGRPPEKIRATAAESRARGDGLASRPVRHRRSPPTAARPHPVVGISTTAHAAFLLLTLCPPPVSLFENDSQTPVSWVTSYAALRHSFDGIGTAPPPKWTRTR